MAQHEIGAATGGSMNRPPFVSSPGRPSKATTAPRREGEKNFIMQQTTPDTAVLLPENCAPAFQLRLEKYPVTLSAPISYCPPVAHAGDAESGAAADWQNDIAAWLHERDEGAARRLMAALYPLVISIIRTRLPRRMDAEDLA